MRKEEKKYGRNGKKKNEGDGRAFRLYSSLRCGVPLQSLSRTRGVDAAAGVENGVDPAGRGCLRRSNRIGFLDTPFPVPSPLVPRGVGPNRGTV